MKKQYASKEKVSCKFCNKSFRKDALDAHCRSKHAKAIKAHAPSVAAMFARPCVPESTLTGNIELTPESAIAADPPVLNADPGETTPSDVSPSKRPRLETDDTPQASTLTRAPSSAVQLQGP